MLKNFFSFKKNKLWIFFIKLFFLLIIFLFIFIVLTLEYTSKPNFCITCHYMRPFYDSWKKSKHNHVNCIECHFPPGLKNKLEGKFKSLSQVAKYVTRTYGTKPYAEIEDSSCLKSACHIKQNLKDTLFIHFTRFNHKPHLNAVLKGEAKLRCTSCHTQITQSSHMTVTIENCFLCHFKKNREEKKISECLYCHKKEILIKNKKPLVEHKDILNKKIDCIDCHYDIVKGDGFVPKNRCIECHGEKEKIIKYGAVEFIHKKHITEHKVDCLRCHTEIIHSLSNREDVVSLDCQRCHPKHHINQKNLYIGKGQTDVKHLQDPMYLARVSCIGCHKKHIILKGKDITFATGKMSCIKCHNKKYGHILDSWKRILSKMVNETEKALKKSESELKNASMNRIKNINSAENLLSKALSDFEVVKYGKPIHNIIYSQLLMEQAVKNINEAMKLIGSKYRAFDFGDYPLISKSKCFYCHLEIEKKILIFGERKFIHKAHIDKGGIGCDYCHHISERPVREKHGMLKINFKDCALCHK